MEEAVAAVEVAAAEAVAAVAAAATVTAVAVEAVAVEAVAVAAVAVETVTAPEAVASEAAANVEAVAAVVACCSYPPDLPRYGVVEACEQLQDGGLAAATGTDHRAALSRPHAEGHVLQDLWHRWVQGETWVDP